MTLGFSSMMICLYSKKSAIYTMIICCLLFKDYSPMNWATFLPNPSHLQQPVFNQNQGIRTRLMAPHTVFKSSDYSARCPNAESFRPDFNRQNAAIHLLHNVYMKTIKAKQISSHLFYKSFKIDLNESADITMMKIILQQNTSLHVSSPVLVPLILCPIDPGVIMRGGVHIWKAFVPGFLCKACYLRHQALH